ncbi:MAG TPA: hypothetical protein VEQ63_16215, partial [Bryobacteraceae bacterium]|nr:hypothetical protein [Bryobacteraceae bacterium]
MKEPSLIEIWCEHLAKVLEFMAGETVATTWMLDAAANLPNSVDRWIELRFSEGAAWLCVPPLSWKGLGALMLGAKEFTDDQTELAESTWLEVVAQVSAGVAAALSARIDREIRPLRPAMGEAEASGASRYVVGVRVAGSDFPLVLAFGKDLHRVLDQAPTRTPAQARPRDEEFEKPSDIDLLMDVELPISVSF